MPCIPLPVVEIPPLPNGITLAPTLPSLKASVPGICCLLPEGLSIELAVPLPPLTVNFAFLEPIEAAIEAAEAWIASIPHDCPRT